MKCVEQCSCKTLPSSMVTLPLRSWRRRLWGPSAPSTLPPTSRTLLSILLHTFALSYKSWCPLEYCVCSASILPSTSRKISLTWLPKINLIIVYCKFDYQFQDLVLISGNKKILGISIFSQFENRQQTFLRTIWSLSAVRNLRGKFPINRSQPPSGQLPLLRMLYQE